MTLNQILYFQKVARLENYHYAAEELYVSQPIPPGFGVREFDMKRALDAGSYPITIHVASSALESDESESSAAYNAGELAATLIVR